MIEGRIEKDYFLFHLNKEGSEKKEVLEYSKSGEILTTETVEFRTPGMDEFKEASTLSQLVMGAMMDAAKHSPNGPEDKDKKEPEIDAGAIKIIFFTSQEITFVGIAAQFNLLAVKVGTTDGDTNLTPTLIKRLKLDTYIRMVCEYIANFILPSLLSETREG